MKTHKPKNPLNMESRWGLNSRPKIVKTVFFFLAALTVLTASSALANGSWWMSAGGQFGFFTMDEVNDYLEAETDAIDQWYNDPPITYTHQGWGSDVEFDSGFSGNMALGFRSGSWDIYLRVENSIPTEVFTNRVFGFDPIHPDYDVNDFSDTTITATTEFKAMTFSLNASFLTGKSDSGFRFGPGLGVGILRSQFETTTTQVNVWTVEDIRRTNSTEFSESNSSIGVHSEVNLRAVISLGKGIFLDPQVGYRLSTADHDGLNAQYNGPFARLNFGVSFK